MYGLAGRLIRTLSQTGKRFIPQPRFAPASLLDPVTNPKTYQGLAQSASDTLGRALPPQFRGAGFQNVPTSALGALDDAAAAPFAGPIRQQVLDKASKEFARKAGSGVTNVPIAPRGGQPVNPSAPGRYTYLKDKPIPNKGALKSPGILGRATRVGGRFLPVAGGVVDAGLRINRGEDPMDAIGRATFGTVGGLAGGGVGGLFGLTTGPGAVAVGIGGGYAGYNAGTGLYDQLKSGNFLPGGMPGADALSAPISKGSPRDFGPRYAKLEAEAFQKAKLHQPPTPITAPPLELPQQQLVPETDSPIPPQVPDPSIGRTVTEQDVKPQVVDTSTQLPASAEQTYIDPYAYQLQVYGQGRNAAQSQSEMDKVRDLGLAIHRNKFPKFYNNTSMSYQMREMFPDRSTQSLENTIQEKGVQLPGSMTQADAENELLSSQEEDRIYQLDEAVANVEELLRQIAERRQK